MRTKHLEKLNKKAGFVMLFAVTLSAIMLSIALGISSIAEKEIKFGTSARDATDAFNAADTGIECAMFFDKTSVSTNAFRGTAAMNCGGLSITPVQSPPNFWTFAVTGLGSSSASCAKVTVDKRASPVTTIVSKGYNVGSGACNSNNPTRTERQLDVTYISQTP